MWFDRYTDCWSGVVHSCGGVPDAGMCPTPGNLLVAWRDRCFVKHWNVRRNYRSHSQLRMHSSCKDLLNPIPTCWRNVSSVAHSVSARLEVALQAWASSRTEMFTMKQGPNWDKALPRLGNQGNARYFTNKQGYQVDYIAHSWQSFVGWLQAASLLSKTLQPAPRDPMVWLLFVGYNNKEK
jgi:hypothetical protein